jgi:hypothetical protein
MADIASLSEPVNVTNWLPYSDLFHLAYVQS